MRVLPFPRPAPPELVSQAVALLQACVAQLERAAAAAGVSTIYLGTDDSEGRTSLAGVDLFPGVLARAAAAVDRAGHPFAFYQRIGFEIVGVIPDANGPGEPDILMAKRVSPQS